MDTKNTILFVEDDPFITNIYQTKLKQEGFEVIVAQNGSMALDALKRATPNLIMLDLVIPGMDGIAVLREIKKNEKLASIPVIMLTNISEQERVKEALAAGVNDYLIKSHFNPSEVMEKIKALLSK